jgi:hypothetical protein
MTLPRSVRPHWRATDLVAATAGLFAGAAMVLNHFAELPALSYDRKRVLTSLAMSAIATAAAFVLSHRLILRSFAPSAPLGSADAAAFARRQAATYLVFLLFAVGSTGFRMPGIVFSASIIALFALSNALLIFVALPEHRRGLFSSPAPVAVLFFASGVAALVYQVTWQRALFSCFGVNIESATVVVTTFMFGLGIGSIAGGLVSRRAQPITLLKGFLACELLVGAFGLISVPLIRSVGSLTISSSLPVTALVIFGLLSIPTLLMGATLPLLVTYAHRQFSNVGRSVGLLYFVNTLGSALACYLTADVLFVLSGEQAATIIAASFNFAVGFAVYRLLRRPAVEPQAGDSKAPALTEPEPESIR